MQSRLDDLRAGLAKDDAVKVDLDDAKSPVADALAPYEDIQFGIEAIDKHTADVTALRSRFAASVREDEHRAIMSDLDGIMLATRREGRSIKKKLDGLMAENAAYLAKNPASTSGQMRENLLASHAARFQKSMQAFQDATTAFNDAVKTRIARQAKIVKPDITDEEMEQVVQGGNPSAILQDAMSAGDGEMTETMRQIEEKHQKMLEIEQGVKELQELFNDMAVLVDLQGETLNVIERNVAETKSYAHQGETSLQKAEVYQASARKKKMIILLILMIIVALCILYFFGPWG
ncbi:t-SNARE coiled-coil homology domain-containing protein [Plasmodiophora brassicae]|uniref:t-SNARE coiled-coil homology domain-containing protein n=1 Tax=Plasmodiophora brassicae TaxID=37360 RepID=A0A0G4IXP5_PLABS|nr:hypothetical protein PBRA_007560 [Plasmodiophora brassicae]SPR02084.1 unnamed protein product [Plasmodiophora brassicae]